MFGFKLFCCWYSWDLIVFDGKFRLNIFVEVEEGSVLLKFIIVVMFVIFI